MDNEMGCISKDNPAYTGDTDRRVTTDSCTTPSRIIVQPVDSTETIDSIEKTINSNDSDYRDRGDPTREISTTNALTTESINITNTLQPRNRTSRTNSTTPNRDNNNTSPDNTPAVYNMKFGWKWITPKYIQFLNRPIFFVLCLCFSGIAQGLVVTGISFTVLSSIEKQFGLKSSQVALFGTSYDIAYGICSVFVGYVGHRHKPRCIAWGIVIMTVGTVTLAIPKFIFGTYEAGFERSSDFCRATNVTQYNDQCTDGKAWYYQFIFIIGNVLLGIGAIPLYTLAPAHIDEVTKRGHSSMYMGVYFAFCAIGPALGFIIGMPVLNAWVDLKQPENSSILPTDPNWVGAWWLGYLIGAGLLFLPILPMLAFPKEFPNTAKLRMQKLELEDTRQENTKLKHDLKSVWPATKALLKNAPYILLSISYSCECLAIGGYSTFLSKFVQIQFHFTASDSSFYTGIIVITGAAGGILVGGWFVNKYRWNCKRTLRAATIMAFIATVCTAIALIGCHASDIIGQKVDSSGHMTYNFTMDCNAGCHCSLDSYKPICADRKIYYSPCHAGCSKSHAQDKDFYNCSCFPPDVTHATSGKCREDCTLFPLSVVGAFLLLLFTFMNNVPMLNATLRLVNEGQGSFAMGFQQIFIRFLGFIPAPILFGSLIDKSCTLWQRDPCTNETTSCLEYDQAYFRYYMFTLGVVTKFASFLLIYAAYHAYRLPTTTSESSTSTAETNDGADFSDEQPKNVVEVQEKNENENSNSNFQMTYHPGI